MMRRDNNISGAQASGVTRRDFLKFAGGGLAGALIPEGFFRLAEGKNEKPNIIILLCDALSARNMSLYGYPRQTTPHMDAFAGYSTVFHNHYSGGNFTTTGTASLLTGLYAWKHRAINQGGLVLPEFSSFSPHSLLDSNYFKFAFSQNPWSDRLLAQNASALDVFLPVTAYSIHNENLAAKLFRNDRAIASIAVDDFLFPLQGDTPGSLVIGSHSKSNGLNSLHKLKTDSPRYPNGLPEILIGGYTVPYLNETVYRGVLAELSSLSEKRAPYFAFFHLFSPHFPYNPGREFFSLFRDGYRPVEKPVHPLSPNLNVEFLSSQRTAYDRQIAQVDEEFGRLVERLDKAGVLANSYLVLTSDHGEMFERGFSGHGFKFMYEPVLQVPLIVHAPGQTSRQDVYTSTSNTDLLPTILSIAGKEPPAELDGKTLPGLGGQVEADRPIFSIMAEDNSAFGAIKKAVISMRKRNFKLIAYLGYDDQVEQTFELYDLESDPEELENLASKDVATLSVMKDELFTALDEANRNFGRK